MAKKMDPKFAVVSAIIDKTEKYPWMETFFISDKEIMDNAKKICPDGPVPSKRRLNMLLGSCRPIFKKDPNRTMYQKGTKVNVYAFDSYMLARKVTEERHMNNREFIVRAICEYLRPDLGPYPDDMLKDLGFSSDGEWRLEKAA